MCLRRGFSCDFLSGYFSELCEFGHSHVLQQNLKVKDSRMFFAVANKYICTWTLQNHRFEYNLCEI